MHVNHNVVLALMALRRINLHSLAALAHVTVDSLSAWVNDGSDDAVSFEQQLEVLSFLGIRGEAPRVDVVHYWFVHEPLFSRARSNYWALQVVLKAFGSAQAVYISRDSDKAVSFTAKAHFGLKFETFMVILEVTAHPLRSFSFDPSLFDGLAWAPENLGVLLPADEYDKLQPGAMKVKSLSTYLTYSAEMSQWDLLREKALSQGIRAEQFATLLLNQAAPHSVRLEAAPSQVLNDTPTPVPTPVEPATEKLSPLAAPKPIEPADVSEATENGPKASLFTTPVRPATSARVLA